MLPLRISGITSRLACSRQLGRCVGRPHHWRRETWWWNEHVEKAIAAKQKAFKAWKTGKGTRASYDTAKRVVRHAVHRACQEANKNWYTRILTPSLQVYRLSGLADQFRRENADVIGDKPVKKDAKEMSVSEDSEQKAWISTLSLTGTQTTCMTNHQWKARPSQSPLIQLRRLSSRWRQAKHWAHQA